MKWGGGRESEVEWGGGRVKGGRESGVGGGEKALRHQRLHTQGHTLT